MPIYEFYCSKCNTVYSFFSRSVNTEKIPTCPKCKRIKLQRQMSVFSRVKNPGTKEDSPDPMAGMDESKMEKAMAMLASEAESLDEKNPRQAAALMRKLSDMTGMNLGPRMEEALTRMEKGEDPDRIEEEMGDLLEGDEGPFSFKGQERKGRKKAPPRRDEKLYDL